jgi:hypothetical protein
MEALRLVACLLAYLLPPSLCGQLHLLHLSCYYLSLSTIASKSGNACIRTSAIELQACCGNIDYNRSTNIPSLDSWPQLQFAAVPRLPHSQ